MAYVALFALLIVLVALGVSARQRRAAATAAEPAPAVSCPPGTYVPYGVFDSTSLFCVLARRAGAQPMLWIDGGDHEPSSTCRVGS